MSIYKLDDYDKLAVRHLAKLFHEGNTSVEFPESPGVTPEQIEATQAKFFAYEWIYTERPRRSICFVLISPAILEIANELDNPPLPEPKDYPAELEKWYRSKWWSIPFYGVFVGLPAILGYIVMIQQVLQWFGIIEKQD